MPMKRKYIEAEIQKHLRIVPDAAPELVKEYRRLLIEMNQDISDPEQMRRPALALESYVPYRLKQLKKLIPKDTHLRAAMGFPLNPMTYAVLQEMKQLGSHDLL